MRLSSLAPTLILLSATALVGCEDTTGPPTMDDVAGSYHATTLIGHTDAGDIDVLARGGSLTLTLAADGTAMGTLFVPDGDEDGSDLTADLSGTWTLDGDEVTFQHDADTFIRNVTFTYHAGLVLEDRRVSALVSNSTFADVVLVRQ